MKTVQPNSFSKTPIAIRVNLLQFGPSVTSFVFAVLFKHFVNVLSGYFHVSLILVARSWKLNFDKFRDTAPLMNYGLKITYLRGQHTFLRESFSKENETFGGGPRISLLPIC